MLVASAFFACSPQEGADSAAADTDTGADTGRDTALDTTDSSGDTSETGDSDAPRRAMALGIPAYAYPTEAPFEPWIAAAGATSGVVILNPNSGAGEEKDSYYAYAVGAAHAAGATVLGYVPTTYGARSAEDLSRDIGRYFSWYEVDGIFFDEVPGESAECVAQAAAYTSIANIAHADHTAMDGNRAYIAFNPGTDACQEYMPIVDSLVIEEDSGANVLDWTAQEWVATYPPEKLWLLAHSTDTASLAATVAVARHNNIGLVYVTDDVEPNPWDALPTYLDDLQAEVGP